MTTRKYTQQFATFAMAAVALILAATTTASLASAFAHATMLA